MNSRYQTPYLSRGVTLVEMMVTMVIGLFIGATVITMFVETKTLSIQQSASSNTRNDLIAAVSYIENYLLMAGYPNNPTIMSTGIVLSGSQLKRDYAGGIDWENNLTDDVNFSNSSSITIQYQAFEPTIDCVGGSHAVGDIILIRFEFDGTNLNCYGNSVDSVIIARNVTGTFVYGEDIVPLTGVVDEYVQASSVVSASNIISIKTTINGVIDYNDNNDAVNPSDVEDINYSIITPLRNQKNSLVRSL